MDDDSPVTSTSGCDTAVIGVDTPGTTYTCTATSEGGTSSLSATVKRDATAPTATITSPQFTLYDLGQVVQPAFTCSDALSGVAACQGSTNGEPVDTTTPAFGDAAVEFVAVAGTREHEAALVVRKSGGTTLVLNDLVGNVHHAGGMGGALLRLMGFAGDEARIPHVVKRVLVKDRPALRAQLLQWAAIEGMKRILVSHGEPIESDAPRTLRTLADSLS
jgi:hypothetical protein